jgi:hypothetical protein
MATKKKAAKKSAIKKSAKGITRKRYEKSEIATIEAALVDSKTSERKAIYEKLALELNRPFLSVQKMGSTLLKNKNKKPSKTLKVFTVNPSTVKTGTTLTIAGQQLFLKGVILQEGELLKFEGGKLVRHQEL